jgi:lipopolysaccharide transport system ATP-binding protein
MHAIRVDQLGKRFANGLWALDGVSFTVPSGAIVSLLGRNGAGKSVLLKILSRVLRPTRGHAELRGSVAPLLEIGTGFHPELTGMENIFLNGVLLGMRRAEVQRHLDEIIAFSGVEAFLDQPIRHFSSGMAMRLAFAIAVHLDREIFFLDEVLAVGDTDFRSQCQARVRRLAAEGRTIVFVSHGTEFQDLCTSALLLEKGRLLAAGEPHPVRKQYHQLFQQSEPSQ